MAEFKFERVAGEGVCNHCLRPNFNDGIHEQVPELFSVDIGSKSSAKMKVVLCTECVLELRRAAGNAILPGSC